MTLSEALLSSHPYFTLPSLGMPKQQAGGQAKRQGGGHHDNRINEGGLNGHQEDEAE